MPKQIDVKVTKPQNKHGHGGTRTWSYYLITEVAYKGNQTIRPNNSRVLHDARDYESFGQQKIEQTKFERK